MAWKIQYGIFLVLFLVQGCFGVLLEALGIFWGFKPPLEWSSLSLEIRSTPLISSLPPYVLLETGSQNLGNFCLWIWNPGNFACVICNPELHGIRNTNFTDKEPRIHYLESRIKPQHKIQNARWSWIPSYVMGRKAIVVVVVLLYFFISFEELI